MKKSTLLTISGLILLATCLFAESGKVFENKTVKSKILDSERKYAIYLPPDYETSDRNYPVLYLLHGGGDDQTGWVQFGEVKHITDKAIKNGDATPMVIVMPDANTGHRGYFNSPDGKWRYEDFFFEELIPHIEKTYHVKAEKRYRAVAGLSMGGGGTFMYALHQPDMFCSACPLSASTGVRSVKDTKRYYERAGLKYTDEQIEEHLKKHNVLELLDSVPIEKIKSVRWYIDCGDGDFLYEGNSLVHIAMRKKEISHEFRIRDGAHEWNYWRSALPEILKFITVSFHQK